MISGLSWGLVMPLGGGDGTAAGIAAAFLFLFAATMVLWYRKSGDSLYGVRNVLFVHARDLADVLNMVRSIN
jgi:hypothetical protein